MLLWFSFQFWSTVLQCGARLRIHFKLLNRVVGGASVLTGGVFECDIAHRRSVAVLCMLCKIHYNSTHPLYGALRRPYLIVRVTRASFVALGTPLCYTCFWGLRTYMVFIALSQPCIVNLFLNKNNTFLQPPHLKGGVALSNLQVWVSVCLVIYHLLCRTIAGD